MPRIVYIYKEKDTNAAWSSVISELGDYLQERCEQCEIIHVNNSNKKTLSDSREKLDNLNLDLNDIIIINHAICFWLLLKIIVRLKKKGVKIVFLFHEHEHILGINYCLRNIFQIKPKEWLRHFKYWYKLPTSLATHTVCLSLSQSVVLNQKNYERLSFLGIDPYFFPRREKNISDYDTNKMTVMFPHDPNRFDKGGRFFNSLKKDKKFHFTYGRDLILPYSEVFKKYHNSDIIFLPSDSESYSLVLAEALATNSCIITNSNVGIVQLLLSSYTVSELEDFGLFICHHSETGYISGLEKAENFLNNHETNTSRLFNFLKLDKKSAYNRFLTYICRIEKSDV